MRIRVYKEILDSYNPTHLSEYSGLHQSCRDIKAELDAEAKIVMATFGKSVNAALAAAPDGGGFRIRAPCFDNTTYTATLTNARDIEVVVSISAGCSDGAKFEAAERVGFDVLNRPRSFFNFEVESIRLPAIVKSLFGLRVGMLSFILEDLPLPLADRDPARECRHIHMLSIASSTCTKRTWQQTSCVSSSSGICPFMECGEYGNERGRPHHWAGSGTLGVYEGDRRAAKHAIEGFVNDVAT